MDELRNGQLDTGSWSGGSALSSTNVYIEISNTDYVMGDKEFA
tara:strand:- start:339 stop:467 length:129 start_codon:yes stop_codon:yes gene_type:complete